MTKIENRIGKIFKAISMLAVSGFGLNCRHVHSEISKYMAVHGLGTGAFIYIADSAAVTKKNLIKRKRVVSLCLRMFPGKLKGSR